MTDSMFRFPGALRRLRIRSGLLQKTIAHNLRLDPGQFCAVERGVRRPFDAATIDRVAELLDLPARDRLDLEWAARHDRLLKHAMRDGATTEEVELYSLCLEALHNLRGEQRSELILNVRKFNESAKVVSKLTPMDLQPKGGL